MKLQKTNKKFPHSKLYFFQKNLYLQIVNCLLGYINLFEQGTENLIRKLIKFFELIIEEFFFKNVLLQIRP